MSWLPAFDRHGQGPRVALLTHGIFGNRGNWRSFARRLAGALPDWTFLAVDHRHHGDSRGAPPPDTLAACAEDLVRLAAHLGVVPEVSIGHSFGGKVALVHAARAAEVRRVFVLDAPPGPGTRGGEDHEVSRVLRVLRDVPQPLARREQVVTELEARGMSRAIALWMTTNVAAGPDGFCFRFDVDGCERLLADYFAVDGWPLVDERVHMVLAARSDRWDDATRRRLDEGPATVQVLPNAGHWLHADNPDGLLALLVAGFPIG